MYSIVKMGNALYLKVSKSLDHRSDFDELCEIKKEFERSGDESFIFDFSALQTASEKACNFLASIQEEARKKGQVYVLTPHTEMLDQLIAHQAIKMCEIYENRGLIGVAMKERVKGNIPVT